MIIALLFDWGAYPESKNYWHDIRDAVFSNGIIQRSGRHMKLSIGDVLVGLKAGQDAQALYSAAFNSSKWSLVHPQRLRDGFPTIFGMVFENMPQALAEELNEALSKHEGYLGAISVHFEFPQHLYLYRLNLPLRYRLQGKMIRSFYSIGEEDSLDSLDLEQMESFGYTDAGFEDLGAARTILDDFDTPRHFQRVADFRRILTSSLPDGVDDAYQLVMMLEDLNPKLFNTLGAAAERLSSAETEEDVAQVALSGRRYLEQLADALFPPTDTPQKARKLDKAAYKNRLWAYAEHHLQGDRLRLASIGKEIDRVVLAFNAGLHADRTKEQVASSISDAAVLTAKLFALNPSNIRNGYLAYMDTIRAFFGSVFKN